MAARCHLTRMPLELLAEILSHTRSPRDVLALARSSKHFCAILVNNKATEFIWRHARARAHPQRVPDFTPDFTESSFAAFLFDSRACEVCQEKTKDAYHSFALRGAICHKPTCLETWRTRILRRVTPMDKIDYPEFLHWIPRLEREDGYYNDSILVRETDWQLAINEHKQVHLLGEAAIEAYVQTKQTLADALPAKTEFYKTLLQWAAAYDAARKQTVQRNKEIVHAFADIHELSIKDAVRATSLTTLQNAKNRSVEILKPRELAGLLKVIKAEITTNKERDARRAREHALQERIEAVRATWDGLRSGETTRPALPHLTEFRALPVIKIYESPATPAARARAESSSSSSPPQLRDPFVASVLAENLRQWREDARAKLAGVLGFPGWRALSKRKLHPVDRLTARFRCKRCDRTAAEKGRRLDEDGGMDFAQACEHECAHVSKKKKRERWSVERFVPDRRAIDAISQVLALCGTSPDSIDSARIADAVGDHIQCQSCSRTMDVRSVGRHCKRHVDCSFILLPMEGNTGIPTQRGLAKKLIKAPASTNARAERDLKIYGCRHCVRILSSVSRPARKPFSFNGLRSHLKEKHAINWVADEDFFRYNDVDTSTAAAASSITINAQ